MHELKAICVVFFPFFPFWVLLLQLTLQSMHMKRLNKKVKKHKIPFGERNIQSAISRSYKIRWTCALVQVEQI